MNSSTKENDKLQHLSFTVGAGITCIAGIMIHIFIVAVNVTDWMKGRPVTVTDQILTSLGITRLLYQSAGLLIIFYYSFIIKNDIIYEMIANCILSITFYASNWLSNLLAVVFCLKICNFHNVFFLRLKTIILQRVVHLIITSVLLSICHFSIFNLIAIIDIPESSYNSTYIEEIIAIYMYMDLLLDTVPFLMFLISSVLLISSLCHHMNRMRCDQTVTGQLDAYYKTIKFSAFLLISYAFYFVAHVTICFYPGSLDIVGIIFILNVFPTLQSIYLIYVTARLRNRFSAILKHGTNCWIFCRDRISKTVDPMESITQRLKRGPCN